ncbi:exodeoxyribonuclease VII small subunit [Inconstantimicrobium mannanitabidum]|uniref:Exodeoxyribonuclease 7 small subunit n=1 Tax=Inconstantimicrobium mannanitabidum TaxID=1604901 RepID=A0ACB5RAD9_9CLOT|nr:exodeoxyribonuclease VII small subunit [Clostridium sp. TW13]GKX66157.1 exodeoxyribonuclease 7 small subunit [Clostridium sp. TW13]
MPKKIEKYEDMMKELQVIVDEFETKELDLDEAMNRYENGLKLVNKLYKVLNSYEGKIKIINDKYGEVDFEE